MDILVKYTLNTMEILDSIQTDGKYFNIFILFVVLYIIALLILIIVSVDYGINQNTKRKTY